MQTLSMIDTSVNPMEAVVPARSAEPQGKQFGKVLHEQRKPETAETRQHQAEKPAAKPVEKAEARPVEKQEPKQVQAAPA